MGRQRVSPVAINYVFPGINIVPVEIVGADDPVAPQKTAAADKILLGEIDAAAIGPRNFARRGCRLITNGDSRGYEESTHICLHVVLSAISNLQIYTPR